MAILEATTLCQWKTSLGAADITHLTTTRVFLRFELIVDKMYLV
jgi:hypothetical protein